MEQPPPDTKDWTWVLEQPCPECGYRADAADRDQIGALMRANAATFRAALQRGKLTSQRPPVPAGQPPKWSALEYAGHVVDVYGVAEERLTRLLKKKNPTFPDWDQNHAALEAGYAQADPEKVSYRLAVNAGKVADVLDRVRGGKWDRTGSRSDGATFTVESLARYILHDVSHHAWDVEQGFAAIREEARRAAERAAGGAGAVFENGSDD